MPAKINPEVVVVSDSLNIADLFKDRFAIPQYQRDYVWTRQMVKRLWDDLESHFQKNSSGDLLRTKPDGYFLGAFVAMKDPTGPGLEVIDGQQRLTTLICLASVLVDKVSALPNGPDKDGFRMALKGITGRFEGGGWAANVTFPDDALSQFFLESCVKNEAMTAKTAYWATTAAKALIGKKAYPAARVKEAIECLDECLEEFLGAAGDREARLYAFAQMFSECVILLRIVASSHSTAYTIFESLNYRGMPLNQADLIKNEILKQADGDRDDIVDTWTYVRDSISSHETLSLPEFMHYSFLSRHGKLKAGAMFQTVQKMISEKKITSKKYVEELKQDADALDALVHGDNTLWDAETNNTLRDIRDVLGVKLAYPFLFAAHRFHSTDKDTFKKLVKFTANLAFRHMKVLDGDLGVLANAMSDAATLLASKGTPDDVAALFKKVAPDALFEEAFKAASFNNTKLAYYCVYQLEIPQLAGTLPLPHGKEQNLEHIMPKTPSEAHWPDALQLKQADSDAYREMIWRIGNLLPLPEAINKSIKNKGVAHKIKNSTNTDYNNSNLVSPKKVEDYLKAGSWTFESIRERQEDLAKIAVTAWSLG